MRALLFLLALPLADPVRADDKPPPKPERLTLRVLGLFSPDRVKDLRESFAQIPDVKLVSVDFDFAEIVIEFVGVKAFPYFPPKDYPAALDGKLAPASSHTFHVKPRSTAKRSKLKTVVIPVAGLDCKGCALAAYEAVARVDGVEQATASFKELQVTALIDPDRTNRDALEAALRRAEVQVPRR
jgi:hypothetical protein